MKKLTILFLFCCLNFFETFSQDFQWAYKTREVSTIYGANIWSVVTDSQGNVYGTGGFGGTFDFDDSQNDNLLTPVTTISDGFVVKLDKYKNFQWVKQIKSLGNGRGRSIILDQNENLIITGITSGQIIDLDPHPTNQFIINNPTGVTGGFIIKLDLNGNFLTGNFYPNYFAKESTIDSNNNIITTGNIGTSSSLNNKIFIIKSNSNCVLLWEKLIQGNNIYPHSLVCDNSNNIIVKGNFMYNMLFSNITYSSTLYSDFICKLDNNGQSIWYQKLGETASAGISNEDKSIKVDNQNNIFFSTRYINPSSININGQNIALPHIFSTESVLFKVNQNGNHIWNVPIYGDERQEINSIALNNNGEINLLIYTSGQSFILNNNNQIFPTSSSSAGEGGVIAKINSTGSFISSKHIVYGGYSLFTDYEDNILIGGSFNNQQDFDPSPNSQYLMNSFRGSGFILKLGLCDSSQPNGSNNQSFCSSQNPTIANLLPNSNSIKWYDSLTSIIQLPSSTVLVNGQTYYAANQNGSCPESSRLAVTVTINQTPNPPIINNQVFCESDNATISTLIASGLNIKWYASLTDTTELPSNHLLTSANYYATQTINNCESDRIGINVTVNSNSLPTATSPQTFCIQQNATVNDIIISGTNINWYNSSTAGNLLPNSTSLIDGTTYYASQTINGCESLRVPVTISIQNTPIPTGNASQEFCATSSPTLSDISVSGTAINWYANNAGTTILPNSTLLVDGTTYLATQTINGCESVGRLMINVSLINTLNANDYSQSFCDDLNDGSENVVLSDYNSNLIASTTGMNFTYYSSYYDAENEIITNQLNTNYTLSIGSTVVYVRLDSANGCHQIVELNLSLFQKPVIPIVDVMPICKTSTIVVNAGSGFNSYSWSTGASSQSIVISAAGTYSVTVTKNYGSLICSSTKTFNVVQSEIATITSIDTQDWTDTENVIIVSTAINDNYLYSLDGINYQVSNTFSGLPSGFYTVHVKDECGIVDEDVVLLNYPKFFTPNDDGTNDYWRIKFSQYEPNLTVTIFDRYGKIMKVLNPNSVGWDGTYNGTKMISDDYWFVVKREDGREHRAHFTLKR